MTPLRLCYPFSWRLGGSVQRSDQRVSPFSVVFNTAVFLLDSVRRCWYFSAIVCCLVFVLHCPPCFFVFVHSFPFLRWIRILRTSFSFNKGRSSSALSISFWRSEHWSRYPMTLTFANAISSLERTPIQTFLPFVTLPPPPPPPPPPPSHLH